MIHKKMVIDIYKLTTSLIIYIMEMEIKISWSLRHSEASSSRCLSWSSWGSYSTGWKWATHRLVAAGFALTLTCSHCCCCSLATTKSATLCWSLSPLTRSSRCLRPSGTSIRALFCSAAFRFGLRLPLLFKHFKY